MTLSCILLALILDAFLGEPVWIWSKIPHPTVLMGRIIKWCELKYNNGINRKNKGILFIASMVIFLAIFGYLIEKLPFSAIWKILIVAILLSHKSLTEHVTAVSLGLQKNLSQGRTAVAMIVGRDTANLAETDIARSAIESAAENFSDGIIAPLFWFLIGGLPGILIYKFVNTSDSMIGYKNIQYNQFGWAAARLDDLLNWIPARLSGLLICIVHQNNSALNIMWRDAKLHRSPNAGWPESAMAGVLDVSISGPRSYEGVIKNYPFVNVDGKKKLTAVDIDNAVDVLWRSWGGLVLGCGVILFFSTII
ncbi:adenosylcobinamide-phosphate synthase CbiB [Paracoccaceae bacterium]|jgi:adenosylcobinamide-phosphate synthase|nr:cobalamin biosynthesis protein [Paracoccaceae bacterium]MDA9122446.1 adenosylcobinamide-phosphate synthase CbiB [Paracoccaceae bacterium]|tara:strand:- start:488 stop:1411 length:924 start_codon:yes stop_codon:yes gene_type:complete